MITQEQLKTLISYNPDTGKLYRNGVDISNQRMVSILGKNFLTHRLIWLYMTGENPLHQVDHINRNQTDNRWCNLREATNQENNRNKSIRSDNTTGCRGVKYYKNGNRLKRYQARIKIDGKYRSLGYYLTAEEASEIYESEAKNIFGEFYCATN